MNSVLFQMHHRFIVLYILPSVAAHKETVPGWATTTALVPLSSVCWFFFQTSLCLWVVLLLRDGGLDG